MSPPTTSLSTNRDHRDEVLLSEKLAGIRVTWLSCIDQLGENVAQHLAVAPLLKAAMHRLVVRVALRKHVPLRAGVQYPQHRLENSARGHGLATRSFRGEAFLREVLPYAFPLLVAQSNHARNCKPITSCT